MIAVARPRFEYLHSPLRFEYQVVPKGSPEYDDPWGPTHPEGRNRNFSRGDDHFTSCE